MKCQDPLGNPEALPPEHEIIAWPLPLLRLKMLILVQFAKFS
jgi:hypothetical protein